MQVPCNGSRRVTARAPDVFVALGAVGVVGILVFAIHGTGLHQIAFQRSDSDEFSLDGCYHVYLDVGSNVGVQVRKLFEPGLYPKAPALAVFDEHFGPDRLQWAGVCAVGFEPNPKHAPRLRQLQQAYAGCGRRVYFFTETAVSVSSGVVPFFSDNNAAMNEWGASIMNVNVNMKPSTANVTTISLADFILRHVATRRLPKWPGQTAKPSVVMKLDIEGSEVEVIPDVLVRGALQHVNLTMMEWHPNVISANDPRQKLLADMRLGVKAMAAVNKNINVTELDDESYLFDHATLPNCTE